MAKANECDNYLIGGITFQTIIGLKPGPKYCQAGPTDSDSDVIEALPKNGPTIGSSWSHKWKSDQQSTFGPVGFESFNNKQKQTKR